MTAMPTDPRNWSDEGKSLEGAVAIEPSRRSNRAKVLDALRAGPIITSQLEAIGGSEGTRRLRELRQEGHTITCERVGPGSTEFRYTLIPPEAPPSPDGGLFPLS